MNIINAVEGLQEVTEIVIQLEAENKTLIAMTKRLVAENNELVRVHKVYEAILADMIQAGNALRCVSGIWGVRDWPEWDEAVERAGTLVKALRVREA